MEIQSDKTSTKMIIKSLTAIFFHFFPTICNEKVRKEEDDDGATSYFPKFCTKQATSVRPAYKRYRTSTVGNTTFLRKGVSGIDMQQKKRGRRDIFLEKMIFQENWI